MSPTNVPLPCGLATETPTALAPGRCQGSGALVACIDEIYAIDGTCETTEGERHGTFASFTALPPPNRLAPCDPETSCSDGTVDDEIRFTVDGEGNVLVPLDYTRIRVFLDGVPIARLVRAATTVDAFAGPPQDPLRLPGIAFLSSFSPRGDPIHPLSVPLTDPESGSSEIFGTVDANFGVLRLQRRSDLRRQCTSGTKSGLPCNANAECGGGTCGEGTCQSGPNVGQSCDADAECPSSECGPSLFRFSDRLVSGVGPAVVSDAEVTVQTEAAVPLAGLNETPKLFAFVASEGSEGDLNGDGDTTDSVLTLRDRDTGVLHPIGSSSSKGRAATEIRQWPARTPAVAVEGDIAAYLEPEPLQSYADQNGDGDVFDTMLRVYQVTPAGVVDRTPVPTPTGDGAPAIDRAPVALSDGLVIVRTRESDLTSGVTEALSVSTSGIAGNGNSYQGPTSDESRHAFFVSTASNLVDDDANGTWDVFVRDRDTEDNGVFDEAGGVATRRLSLSTLGAEGDAASGLPASNVEVSTSGDGRHVVFASAATNLVPGDGNARIDIFVRDRDPADTGILDATASTVRMSIGPTGEQPDGNCESPVISSSGRFVGFRCLTTNLLPPPPPWPFPDLATSGIYIRDRDPDDDGIFDESSATAIVRIDSVDEAEPLAGAGVVHGITGSGRHVLYYSNRLLSASPAVKEGLVVQDRDIDEDGIYDEPGATRNWRVCDISTATADCGYGWRQAGLSDDGRLVAFGSSEPDLLPGDFASPVDAYLYDRDPDADGIFDEPGSVSLRRVSLGSNGAQADQAGYYAGPPSRDGRWIPFLAVRTGLVPPYDFLLDAFVHDRDTGITRWLGVPALGVPIPTIYSIQGVGNLSLSGDARTAVFESHYGYVAGFEGSPSDVFVRSIDSSAGAPDLDGDGNLDDTVLRVIDARDPVPSITNLGPALAASAAAGTVAFLREPDGEVRTWSRTSGGPVSLARKSDKIAMSPSRIAALVSEAREAASLNGDADMLDTVLHVTPVSGASPASWTNVGQAAQLLSVSRELVAFTTGERSQGGVDRTSDGDDADVFIQLYDAAAGALRTIQDDSGRRQPVDDFVVRDTDEVDDELLGFRTPEAAFCDASEPPVATTCAPAGCTISNAGGDGCDLNGDGDCCDAVMQVYDATLGKLWNTAMAALPCTVEGCDPRRPYRLTGRTVSFLTFEPQQGADLNDDGDVADLLLHAFTAPTSATAATPGVAVAAQTSAGVCTTTGLPCASDAECSGGACIVPPGTCIEQLSASCTLDGSPPCPTGQFCRLINSTESRCHLPGASCRANVDCITPLTTCEESGIALQDVIAPLVRDSAGGSDDGRQLTASAGLCIETLTAAACATADDCAAGQSCGPAGHCEREHGACAKDADCASDSGAAGSCAFRDLTTIGAADVDVDGVPDPIDNCPDTPNPSQANVDQDAAGDACDEYICGNGVREPPGVSVPPGGEECDDGNLVANDDCDELCRSRLPCYDDVDNDGDGLIDSDGNGNPTLRDLGCGSAYSPREDPQCNNGLDDDGDGAVDLADSKCKSSFDDDERTNPPPACGLGMELLLALTVLSRLRSSAAFSKAMTVSPNAE